jgi:hypothetical protein
MVDDNTKAPADPTDRLRRLTQLTDTGAVQSVHAALAKVRGLVMDTPFSGSLRFGNRKASLRLETEDNLHVAWQLRSPMTPDVCPLSVNHLLAGNARIAIGRRGPLILADTQVNGQAHLPSTLAHIQASLRCAADVTSGKQPAPPTAGRSTSISAAQLETLVAELGWEQDAVVRLADGWDLRPRLHHDVVPVSMAPLGTGLRLSRVVLTNAPEQPGDRRSAVLDHAVRTNARLRGARLAMCDGNIVAETCLHTDQLHGKWLRDAVYAVATAAHVARPGLRILVDQPAVAEAYMATVGWTPVTDNQPPPRHQR